MQRNDHLVLKIGKYLEKGLSENREVDSIMKERQRDKERDRERDREIERERKIGREGEKVPDKEIQTDRK